MTAPDDPFKKTGEPYRAPGEPVPPASGDPAYGQQGYGQQGYAPPGGYGPPPSSGSNGLAIAALVVGILAFLAVITVVGGLLLGLVAIVLGALGLRRSKRGAGGGVMAGFGLGLGVLSLVLSGALLAFGLSLFTSGEGGALVDCIEQAQGDPNAELECQAEFEEDFLN